MPLRITGTTKGCLGCPHRLYYSGGAYECEKTDTRLPFEHHHNDEFAPENCPLPTWPSAKSAEN